MALAADYDLALAFAGDEVKAAAAAAKLAEMAPQAQVRTYKAPLTDYASATNLVQTVTADFGRAPLVLVNSAGRINDGLFMGLKFEQHAQVINEHLLMTMAMNHACIKAMTRERWGRIINLSSISATFAKRGQTNYAAAKAGIEAFTKTLALEVAHRGVTVNAVAPGLIETPMTQQILAKFNESDDLLKSKIPAGYAGSPEDVGSLIGYLASDKARYITGTVIKIDGGRSLGDSAS